MEIRVEARRSRWLAMAVLAPLAACGPRGPTQPPKLMGGETPVQYPVKLWDERIEGETTLMLHVTDAGSVDSVFVEKTSGIPEFDSAAVSGARLMRFVPGRQGNDRRAMWTRLPVHFRVDGTSDVPPPPNTTTSQ